MYRGSSPEHDASSSCGSASPGGDSPARGSQPPPPPPPTPPPVDSLCSASSMDSVDQDPDTSASESFVPTVTAISTSLDLKWMVQPTVLTTTTTTSHSPSRGPARAKARSKDHTAIKNGKKEQPSKEEEERRKIRRERNKIAAAKCRNRRRELTDTLQAETDTLEEEKAALQTEIADLLKEKERLEQVLASHAPGCVLQLNDEEPRDHAVDDDDAAAEMDEELDEDKDKVDDDDEDDGGDDDVRPMQQGPPVSPAPASPAPGPLLSMWPDSESLSEGTSRSGMALLLDGPQLGPQDLDPPPCAAAAAILGNSNILLCSSAEEEAQEEQVEPLEDLRGDDLDDLVPSLEMTAPEEGGGSACVAASVPDIDLGGALGLPDWETLYRSVARDLESLDTPLVSASPTCGGDGYRSVFSFSGPEIDSLQAEDDCLAVRGLAGGAPAELTKDSLNSPTLLAL